MQFNSHATSQDCVSEILRICNATITDYPAVDITRRFNAAMDRYFALAFESDGRWNFDDINNTGEPIDEYNITSGTNKYKLDDFTMDIINIIKVEILTADAKGIELIPETMRSLGTSSPNNESGKIGTVMRETFHQRYVNAPAGTPTHYIKYGDYIYLTPNPNYTEANGLILYVNTAPNYMASTDTTKVPGIVTIHHNYLCRKAALPYLIEKNMKQAAAVKQQIMEDEDDVRRYFSRRTKDIKQRMTAKVEDNR